MMNLGFRVFINYWYFLFNVVFFDFIGFLGELKSLFREFYSKIFYL